MLRGMTSSTDNRARTAADHRRRLAELDTEKAAAGLDGLAANDIYMADLEDEIAAERAAYVGTAVTEIASLRAALSGALQG